MMFFYHNFDAVLLVVDFCSINDSGICVAVLQSEFSSSQDLFTVHALPHQNKTKKEIWYPGKTGLEYIHY